MPLKGPTTSDIEKLNGEINQIVNQRYLLATAAITIFGIFLAALVPLATATTNAGPFKIDTLISGISSGLSLVLFIMFIMHQMLQGTLRAISTYLIETNSSGWQSDWKLYRGHRRWDYIAPNVVVFLMTNGLILGLLIIMASIYPSEMSFHGLPFVISIAITAVIQICILVMTKFRILEREEWSTRIWKKLNSE